MRSIHKGLMWHHKQTWKFRFYALFSKKGRMYTCKSQYPLMPPWNSIMSGLDVYSISKAQEIGQNNFICILTKWTWNSIDNTLIEQVRFWSKLDIFTKYPLKLGLVHCRIFLFFFFVQGQIFREYRSKWSVASRQYTHCFFSSFFKIP